MKLVDVISKSNLFAEQKKQKISEIKAGLDQADALVRIHHLSQLYFIQYTYIPLRLDGNLVDSEDGS